jgi:hypothetical protein
MKVKEYSPFVKNGQVDLFSRIQGSLKYGLDWYDGMVAQQIVAAGLGKALGNRYTLVNNYPLPGTEITIPQILVGPAGVKVLLASPIKGMYQAKEEYWLQQRGGQTVPARPNLIRSAMLLSRALERFLGERGENLMIEPVLVFTHPGVHVDANRPATRIVLRDGIERFAVSLNQASIVLPEEDVYQLVETLTHPGGQDPYAFERLGEYSQTPSAATARMPKPDPLTKGLTQAASKINFSTKQWALLGFILLGQICLIIAFIMLVITAR